MGQTEFDAAAARVKTLPATPTPDILLKLYGLFKQASEGDATGKRPGTFDFKGRAKFDAWAANKGMAKTAAMDAYVALVNDLLKKAGRA